LIEFLGARYIERQPKTIEETVAFMQEVGPVIAQLDEYVEKNGLTEIIELTNSNPVFNMIYKGVKGSLPGRITSLVEIEADSKFF